MEDHEFFQAVLRAPVSKRVKALYVRHLERLAHEWYPAHAARAGGRRRVKYLRELAADPSRVARVMASEPPEAGATVAAAMVAALGGPGAKESAPWMELARADAAGARSPEDWRALAEDELDDPRTSAEALLLWWPLLPDGAKGRHLLQVKQVTKAPVTPATEAVREAVRRSAKALPRQYLFQDSNGGAFASRNSFTQWANRALRRRHAQLSLAALSS